MTTFEVGKAFPLHNYADGNEKSLATFNEAFFDVCFYTHSEALDTKMVKKEDILYGIYEENNVPFFLIRFEDSEMDMDATLNIHKVKADKVEAWLNSQSNIFNFYLINADTNILMAMRMIGMNLKLSEQIRDILEKQDAYYEDTAQVDAEILKIEQKVSLSKMIGKAWMYRSYIS